LPETQVAGLGKTKTYLRSRLGLVGIKALLLTIYGAGTWRDFGKTEIYLGSPSHQDPTLSLAPGA